MPGAYREATLEKLRISRSIIDTAIKVMEEGPERGVWGPVIEATGEVEEAVLSLMRNVLNLY